MHGGHGRGAGRRGHVRTSILALLTEAPLNGYQIMQALAERTAGAWKPSPGTVYPTLAQLEDEGLIEAFDNGGQKAYRLTEAGQQAAEGIETKPWEMLNERLGGLNPQLVRALWAEWGATAGALKEFSRNATPAQLESATRFVAETRRKLYGLLAEDAADGPDSAGDVHNGDDLR
jgi:DNA-binding PadR family transcriptional regulator